MVLTSDQIAAATGAPQRNVAASWPLIVAALGEAGINTHETQIAAAATIAVETGSFAPVTERHADTIKQPDIYRLQSKYWDSGFMGRGFIQLTGHDNYLSYGQKLGLDLVGNPILASDTSVAAKILALYFKERKIYALADAGDWVGVRRRVNGGTIGLDKFMRIVNILIKEA